MRPYFHRTSQYKRLKSSKAAFPQFIGQCHRCLVNTSILFGIFHILTISIIRIIPRNGITRITKSQKDGYEPINLHLTKTLPYHTRNSTHSLNKSPRIRGLTIHKHIHIRRFRRYTPRLPPFTTPRNPLRQLNPRKQTLHQPIQQLIRNNIRKTPQNITRPLPHHMTLGRKLREHHLHHRLVLLRNLGQTAKPRQQFGRDFETGDGDIPRGLFLVFVCGWAW
mmetsp:Transcript_4995/g.5805  ORF Transcript_4995/g.5805 Transcript_4995/m.5805 type:complete len:222 (-) Transcript_4995:649-1314(-)